MTEFITSQQLETELAEADMAREAYDELAAADTGPDRPVPYELTPEGEAAALHRTLTPSGEVAADAWSRVQWQPEPDTWTRGPVAYEFTRGNEVVAAGFVLEPEAGVVTTIEDVRAAERAAGAVHEPGPELDRLIAEREQVRVAYRQAEYEPEAVA